MAELIYMPVRVDKILSDAGDLPNALFGAYVRLLFRWWAEKALPEPNEKRLARWSGLSSSDFEDLKEFLTETERGWIQHRLMTTYAEALGKSIKATNSANARHGKADAPEVISERIAKGYADRVLSMKHKATVEAKASTEKEKNKKEKKKPSGNVSRETSNLAYPDDPDCLRMLERLRVRHAPSKLATYLNLSNGSCGLRMNDGKLILMAETQVRADMIDQRLGGTLNEMLGRGGWRVELIERLAA